MDEACHREPDTLHALVHDHRMKSGLSFHRGGFFQLAKDLFSVKVLTLMVRCTKGIT